MSFRGFSVGCFHKTLENSYFLKPTSSSCDFYYLALAKPRHFSSGFRPENAFRNCSFPRGRSFSSSYTRKVSEDGDTAVESGRALPWLASHRTKDSRRVEKGTNSKTSRSSWEESADKFLKSDTSNVENRVSSLVDKWENNNENREVVDAAVKSGRALPRLASQRTKDSRRVEKGTNSKTSRSSWEESADKFLESDTSDVENRVSSFVDKWENSNENREVVEEEEGEIEVIDDPRWDKIRNRYDRIVDAKPRFERPEFRKTWDKHESWGRKTWKEATESTVPKMVGEGIYGVGPVLAALSAGRREFYALYIQEGLDLSGNNRKKKDKKGFERVLRIAEKIGLSKREISKHDLNMVVDNRPHQGLVLDGSPLEMVVIRELDPAPMEQEKVPLWVALDEVTDPQNLGAIIRSSYFFGVSGVVLCAKNSAPLSGVVSKASAGSLELMELRSCKNMMQFLVSSAENGWRVLGGSVSSRAIPLNEIEPNAPTILVLGSEGTGLRPLVERSCTQLVRIPGNFPVDTSAGYEDGETVGMDHGVSSEEYRSFLAVESLNVSVAAGVLLHHLIGSNSSDVQTGDREGDVLE